MLKHISRGLPVVVAVALLILGTSTVSMAITPTVPEINSTSGLAAVALLAGAVLVLRGRRKNQA
jgi:LPXTG-motif cell wall-anchored protein